MRALFGAGLHPDAEDIVAALTAAGAEPAEARHHARLGRPFPDYARLPEVDARITERVHAIAAESGRAPTHAQVEAIRREEAGRVRRAVAGYDLVFSPVKSISLLWALGDDRVRAAIEAAHHAAVADAIGWLEANAAFTRIGPSGSLQVETHGFVAAAFDHRESRAGDPDLHTHVAVANKVRARVDHPDGRPRWLSVDGRALYAVAVAASERYNTRVEDNVRRALALQFAARPDTVRRDARPVREIVGIPSVLIKQFSRRRLAVEARYHELARAYREALGQPDRGVRLRLAQQATLETRQLKKAPVRLVDQLARWRAEAEAALGAGGMVGVLDAVFDAPSASLHDGPVAVDQLADAVVHRLEQERSTWSRWNLLAEVERHLRPVPCANPADRQALVGAVTTAASSPARSIRIVRPQLEETPPHLRRSDGTPMTEPHAAERYTTRRILDAEIDLLDAAREHTHRNIGVAVVKQAISALEARGEIRLDEGQRRLATAFCTDDRRIVAAVGPAGAGKTTALRAACLAWEQAGRRVIPLATSAQAAEVLAHDLGRRAENIHKYAHELETNAATGGLLGNDTFYRLGAGDVLLVDEVGMAGTLRLHGLLGHAREHGVQLRLVGDPHQLGAIESGGAFRLLVHDVGAVELTDLHRFADSAEAAATLQLRDGNPRAITHYHRHGRLHAGSREAMLDAAYTAWLNDIRTGVRSLLIASSTEEVIALNQRARLDRIAAGLVSGNGIELHDGTTAGPGDWITTRRNQRLATTCGGRDFVKNGDRWTVERLHPDGVATLRHHTHGGLVKISASYLAQDVDLGYAATAHRVQGATVDTAHVLLTDRDSRETLYVAATRARRRTVLYAITDTERSELPPRTEPDARDLLVAVLIRANRNLSAIEDIRSRHKLRRSSRNGKTAGMRTSF